MKGVGEKILGAGLATKDRATLATKYMATLVTKEMTTLLYAWIQPTVVCLLSERGN